MIYGDNSKASRAGYVYFTAAVCVSALLGSVLCAVGYSYEIGWLENTGALLTLPMTACWAAVFVFLAAAIVLCPLFWLVEFVKDHMPR